MGLLVQRGRVNIDQPTFVHGEGSGFRLRVKLMEWADFHTYFRWSAKEFAFFVTDKGFAVETRDLMNGGVTPLCYLEARSVENRA